MFAYKNINRNKYGYTDNKCQKKRRNINGTGYPTTLYLCSRLSSWKLETVRNK